MAETIAAGRYTPSRCQALYGCVVLSDGVLLLGPEGWICERLSAGKYRITPAAADIADCRIAVIQAAIASYEAPAAAEPMVQPTARTLMAILNAPAAFEVWALDAQQAAVDTPFSVIVMRP